MTYNNSGAPVYTRSLIASNLESPNRATLRPGSRLPQIFATLSAPHGLSVQTSPSSSLRFSVGMNPLASSPSMTKSRWRSGLYRRLISVRYGRGPVLRPGVNAPQSDRPLNGNMHVVPGNETQSNFKNGLSLPSTTFAACVLRYGNLRDFYVSPHLCDDRSPQLSANPQPLRTAMYLF